MKKLSHEEVQISIVEKYPNLLLIEEFKNTRTKITVQCGECGFIQNVNYRNLLQRGFGCNGCIGRLGSEESYLMAMKKLHPDIKVVGRYLGNRIKVECRCIVCGHTWFPTPNGSVNNKQGCPKCVKKLKYTLTSYKELMNKKHPSINVIDTMYVNNKTPVKLECGVCGSNFEQKPCDSINKEYGCPICSISKGEKKIEQWFKENGVEFEREYSFKDLKGLGGRPLRFDFFIPKFNTIVEFDGNQHIYFSKVYHRKYENFIKQQEHDKMKNLYCKNNNIKLLRISYGQLKDIEKILEEEFK